MMKIIYLFFFTWAAFGSCSGSIPNWTSSPDQASVTTCWNNAVAAGGTQTITLPQGAATWSSTWAGNSTTSSITIIGATTVTFSGVAGQSGYSAVWGDNSGSCSSVGTCITGTVDNVFAPQASNNALVRLTGITFINSDSGTSHGILGLSGTHLQTNYRIDHCHFYMSPLALTMFGYNGGGLIDHNQFDDTSTGGGGPIAIGGDLTSAGYLNWQDVASLGTAQGWVIEQNIINLTGPTDGVVDSYYGAKVTFRFNNVIATNNLQNGIGWNHGTDSGGYRSTVLDEIYGNYFANNTGSASEIGNSRGGTVLYWANTHVGNAAWTTFLLQYFRCLGQQYSYPWGSVCNNPGNNPAANLAINWTPVSAVDTSAGSQEVTANAGDFVATHLYGANALVGPLSNNSGHYNYLLTNGPKTCGTYPGTWNQTFPFGTTTDSASCVWMIVGGNISASPAPGTAAGFCAANPDISCSANATCSAIQGGDTCSAYFDSQSGVCFYRDMPGCAHNQTASPNYEWLNSGAQAPAQIFTTNTQTSTLIAQNSNYYDYTGTFTGVSGVGSGTLASRPSTCTTGVAYWATDQGSWNQSGSGSQGILYQCSSTNTWSTYYTPYTYPDPLEGSSPTSSVQGVTLNGVTKK